MSAPLSVEEKTRRVTALTLAATARRSEGAEHQFEVVEINPEERSGTAREAPGTGTRDGALGKPGAIGVQPAAPHITDTLPVDTWRPDGGGITRWRPVTDRVDVSQLPNGARLLVLTNGLRLKLDGECSAHLAWQLMPEEWKIALGARGPAPGDLP